MLSPLVSFARHTDRSTVFGRAPYKSARLALEINDSGDAEFIFDTATLRDIHWTNAAVTPSERVRVWDGPTVILAQVASEWFSFEVQQVRFGYPTSAEFWDGTVTFTCRGGAAMFNDALYLATGALVGSTSALALSEVQGPRAALINVPVGPNTGVLSGLSGTWTSTLDSSGVAWTDNDLVRSRAGVPILRKVEEWAPTTWEWSSTATVVAGVATTALHLRKDTGIDRTATVILFAGAHSLDGRSISETWDFSSIATQAWTEVTGAGVEETSTASVGDGIARWGLREVSISSTPLAQVTQALTDAVTAGATPIRTRTFPIDPTVMGSRPLVDFGLGDRVGIGVVSPRGLKLAGDSPVSTSRVMGIALESSNEGAVRCELILDESLAVRRRRFEVEERSKGEDEGSTFGGISTKSLDLDPMLTAATGGEKGGTLGLWDVPGASSVGGVGAVPSDANYATYNPAAEPSGLPLYVDAGFTAAVPDAKPKVIIQSAKQPGGAAGPAIILDPNTNGITGWVDGQEVPWGGSGFLPGWTQYASPWTGSGDVDAFRGPSHVMAGGNASTQFFLTDYNDPYNIDLGIVAQKGATLYQDYSAVHAHAQSDFPYRTAFLRCTANSMGGELRESETNSSCLVSGPADPAGASAYSDVSALVGIGYGVVRSDVLVTEDTVQTRFTLTLNDHSDVNRTGFTYTMNSDAATDMLGFFGEASTQVAKPTTLAEVIALLEVYGLCAPF